MTEPRRFRKKPVVIEAMRWDGTAPGATEVINWILANGGTARFVCVDPDRCGEYDGDSPHHVAIDTLEGVMSAAIGDWIIRGVQGEFYPIKHEILVATYEEVAS